MGHFKNLSVDVAVEGAVVMSGAKKRDCDVLAFVRVWTEPGQAKDVLGRLETDLSHGAQDVLHGASLLYGSADLLVTFDHSNFETVAAAAQELNEMSGVKRTETAFADVTAQ
jgi:hypothetical protein